MGRDEVKRFTGQADGHGLDSLCWKPQWNRKKVPPQYDHSDLRGGRGEHLVTENASNAHALRAGQGA